MRVLGQEKNQMVSGVFTPPPPSLFKVVYLCYIKFVNHFYRETTIGNYKEKKLYFIN